MLKIYITGTFHENTMQYKGYAEKEDGKKIILHGNLSGSRPETEASAMGVALKFAYDTNEGARIHTDFNNALKFAKGEWRATAKRIKDYIRYVEKVSERLPIDLVSGIPEEAMQVIEKIRVNPQEASKNPFKREKQPSTGGGWARLAKQPQDAPQQHQNAPVRPVPQTAVQGGNFRVIVRDADGKVLCDVNQDDFGRKNLEDAIFFADNFELDGKDKNSFFFGATVERFNVPTRLTKEIKMAVENQSSEPAKPKQKEPEQLSLF